MKGSQDEQGHFEGKWKEMRAQAKEWWGKPTGDELVEKAGGNAGQSVGLLQQKYGYTRQEAKRGFNERIKNVKDAID